jgi:hypothetical protein
VVTGKAFAGSSTYYCGSGVHQGDFYNTPYWQGCMAYWGGSCPCAGDVMGTGCWIHGSGDPQCPQWNAQ